MFHFWLFLLGSVEKSDLTIKWHFVTWSLRVVHNLFYHEEFFQFIFINSRAAIIGIRSLSELFGRFYFHYLTSPYLKDQTDVFYLMLQKRWKCLGMSHSLWKQGTHVFIHSTRYFYVYTILQNFQSKSKVCWVSLLNYISLTDWMAYLFPHFPSIHNSVFLPISFKCGWLPSKNFFHNVSNANWPRQDFYGQR